MPRQTADEAARARRRREPDEPAAVPRARAAARAAGIDRLVHEPVRLAIASALAVNDALSFVELKRMLDVTDGNLSLHARKLEEAGYVTCTKRFEGRSPRTEFRLTNAGRKALDDYLAHMDVVIRAIRSS